MAAVRCFLHSHLSAELTLHRLSVFRARKGGPLSAHLARADLYHLMTWPQLSFVAEDPRGRIVGYILAKMCAPLTP